jgi:pSer/pThr/pTyr-binding forkhead associated (FHA) protein
MASSPGQPVLLIVEKGPEKGREIVIPATGARLGRSSNNDIVIQDPSVSRFHCRFFFKPSEGLWAADLASTNQTLLNENPIIESRIRREDRLTMGATTLKVAKEEAAMEAASQKGLPGRFRRITAAPAR